MTVYNVCIPCTMSVSVIVVADSEEEAEDEAMMVDFRVKLKTKDKADLEIVDFATHSKIVSGNVFYGVLNEIKANEVGVAMSYQYIIPVELKNRLKSMFPHDTVLAELLDANSIDAWDAVSRKHRDLGDAFLALCRVGPPVKHD